jgi:Fur family ferric uptake transcriptional regulator
MSRPQRRFEDWLRDHGLRVTHARVVVLEHAFRHFRHFEINELVESLERHRAGVSRATVYRTLPHLVRAGLLRRHDVGIRQTFYEPEYGRKHHEHMVCVRCGKILEFVDDEIERLQDEICERHRFEPLSHTLQIQGVCRRCQTPTAASGGPDALASRGARANGP